MEGYDRSQEVSLTWEEFDWHLELGQVSLCPNGWILPAGFIHFLNNMLLNKKVPATLNNEIWKYNPHVYSFVLGTICSVSSCLLLLLLQPGTQAY